ncbi:MAG: hypothetical protein WCR54_00185 [Clostridia bacterium]
MNIKKFTRKLLIFSIVAILLFSSFIILTKNNSSAFANSALLYLPANQESSEMIPLSDEDITVASEVLNFDFSIYNESNYNKGKVSAIYDFRNSGDDKTVNMGFPMVTNLDSYKENRPTIKSNDINLDYQTFVEDFDLSGINGITFEVLLDGLNQMQRENTLDEMAGEICSLNRDINENFKIEFDIDFRKTVLYYENCYHYSYKDTSQKESEEKGHIILSATDDFMMFVVGESIKNVNIYDLDDNKIDNVWLTEEDATLQDIMNLDFDFEENINNFIAEEYRNVYLDHREVQEVGCIDLSELVLTINNKNYIFVMVYEVNLLNEGSNMLSVSYDYEGGYDAHYIPTVYQYKYISSPAKNWAEFGTMTINIITNENNPYVINSSLEFKNNGDNTFTSVVDGVPENNISFELCESENPIYNENINNKFNTNLFIFIVAIVIGSIIVIGIIVCIIIIATRKKKIKRDNSDNGNSDNTKRD